MGKRLLGTGLTIALVATACGGAEDSAPSFQVTTPTLATTSTTTPSTLEYIGLPDLTDEENAMCEFVQAVGSELISSDEVSRKAIKAAEDRAEDDRTLSEPLRVRLLRDAELAKAQRFANVLKRFEEAKAIIAAIQPGPLTDQETLDRDAADAALLSKIGQDLQEVIDGLHPDTSTILWEMEDGTFEDDIFLEMHLNGLMSALYNPESGMGRQAEAREAMERLDDWSWRHCAAGLTE